MRPKYIFCVTLVFVSGALSQAAPSIRNFDFKNHLLQEEGYGECPKVVQESCKGSTDKDYCPNGISIGVTYLQLAGNPNEAAIVQGRSCYAGTGGPDIHSVFEMDRDGNVRELSLPTLEHSTYDGLFGNRNFKLISEQGKLRAEFYDDTDRETPLVILYRWAGDGLQVDSVKKAPMFKTSYDCSKAKAEHERAICHVKELADLDLKLDQLYKRSLKNAAGAAKNAVLQAQRKWIAQRNATCVIYKFWVECLKEAYEKRIGALTSSPSVRPSP